jgi:hypothetical protein
MVIIFIVRIYYLKTRFVKGFARILRVQFCSPIEQSSQQFMSDSSMDMKQKSPYTATFKANGGFSGSPLQNNYFVVSGRLVAKTDFRQCEIRWQKFCRRGWLPSASFTVAMWSNRLPGEFSPMIPNHAFIAFRDQGHCHDFLIVRIYYRKMRFIRDFARILAMQFCDAATQRMQNFLSDSSTDMKQKSQHTAETRRMAL